MERTTAERHRKFVRQLQSRSSLRVTKGSRTAPDWDSPEGREQEDLDDVFQRLFDDLFDDED